MSQPLCADIDGPSLQAAARCDPHDRKRLEQLCRCITRPALSDRWVQCNAAGQVKLKLKTPWRDGTTHLVMLPPEFMQRLAAPIPWLRLHQPKSASRRPVSIVGCPGRGLPAAPPNSSPGTCHSHSCCQAADIHCGQSQSVVGSHEWPAQRRPDRKQRQVHELIGRYRAERLIKRTRAARPEATEPIDRMTPHGAAARSADRSQRAQSTTRCVPCPTATPVRYAPSEHRCRVRHT